MNERPTIDLDQLNQYAARIIAEMEQAQKGLGQKEMKYSGQCLFVFPTEENHWSPCSLARGHNGRHRDGYRRERDPEKRWYERVDYQEQFEELSERVEAAGMSQLLEGFKP